MLVPKTQLAQYEIPEDLFFSRRTGSDEPISRDQFFIDNPTRLVDGLYCAIGSDELGWQLEQYNGVNWAMVDPDANYTLVITNDGLAALTNVKRGGLQLYFSGIKILSAVVNNPIVPMVNWTDTNFMQAGEVVFSVGTNGARYQYDDNGEAYLSSILSWRFNSSSGGLQYIINLPPEGFGAFSDNDEEEWSIGTIGLYVKDPNDGVTDVLFGIATLPALVNKYGSTVDRVGNTLKFYINAVLNNLGLVSNLKIMQEAEQNIPEVPNESLLLYPNDPTQRVYNCYVVDNLYGTNIPALAIPRVLSGETLTEASWAFFQPTDNFILCDSTQFAPEVKNYMFVYWNEAHQLYELAEGKHPSDESETNEKAAIGIRIGNSVVFSGEIINKSVSYQYSIELVNGGTGYDVYDELLLLADSGLNFKIQVTEIADGAIRAFRFIGPSVGNIALASNPVILPAIYDPRSQLPRYGADARFRITATEQSSLAWNFDSSWFNKPIYCDKSLTGIDNAPNAGRPTLTKTDSFLGWCTGANSIRLALDLRNEASFVNYGTTRYATNQEVKEPLTYVNASEQTAVCPSTLKANYLQTSLPANPNQTGSSLGKPINVESYVRFDKIVLGKGTVAPYNSTSANPYVTDNSISFYGKSFRSMWADLAEFYEADKIYEPGMLITFGKGEKEISLAVTECDGIISTSPGYQLGEKKSEYHLPVALTGRIPVMFDGHCMPKFGDRIYLSKVKHGYASTVENGKCLGKIIDKNCGASKLIECVVRIDF